MKKLFFACFLLSLSSLEVLVYPASEPERQEGLQESVLQLTDALVLWKEEANTDVQLTALLDQVISRLKDSITPITIKVFYGILLAQVYAVEDCKEQKTMLRHILSQSSHKLMQEAATMIQLLRDEQT